ncbi:hypothetical protein PHYSODRAFT_324489 [Phytophthora sojae]|uniref:Uncharacterized protein n=1 Tax=Phytophthora sojae (strain P6497) TaxID=1094619 RepID=G4YYB1_PHYSP|nr:hypothetical protein PHYSODRAFT_324489 [Phytophthora sojae]EGZ23262.1 hypothetical protein PHYSODRAFT_324489 [Phytophthora sojae]|eukprot:XP_009518550.1 hypothetical protein PHYSODRAFT_324489 [Phytophthora sojae]
MLGDCEVRGPAKIAKWGNFQETPNWLVTFEEPASDAGDQLAVDGDRQGLPLVARADGPDGIEWATDVVNGLAVIVVVAAEAACQVAVERRWELAWLTAGTHRLTDRRYVRRLRPEVERAGQVMRHTLLQALLATPLVVLESKGEHEDGLGRLLYKWLDDLHEWWCACSKYCTGASLESGRSVARAKLVAKVVWTLTSLILFSAFYAVLFTYEVVEWIYQGVAGVFAVVVLASAGERSPLTMATEGYAAWYAALEDQEQAERLSEAFWRMDGGGQCAESAGADAKWIADRTEGLASMERSESSCVHSARTPRRSRGGCPESERLGPFQLCVGDDE